jgi:hypothetical protein
MPVGHRETVAVDKQDLTKLFYGYKQFSWNDEQYDDLRATLDDFFTKYNKTCYNQVNISSIETYDK